MFEAAGCDPAPSGETCRNIADFLSGLIEPMESRLERGGWGGLPTQTAGPTWEDMKRRRDAIGVIRSAIAADRERQARSGELSGTPAWLDLEVALNLAEPVFAPMRRRIEAWHFSGFLIADVFLNVFQELKYDLSTVSENSRVSLVTKLALERIGFPGVTRGAIAKHYLKWEKTKRGDIPAKR